MDQQSPETPRSESPEGGHTPLLNPQSNQRIESHQTAGFPSDDDSERSLKVPFYLNGVSRTSFWLIFAGILAQYFIAFFDHALISSIHPVITSEFNSLNSASWLETAFLLTSMAFQPLAARLSDTFGRRPLHLFSLAVFAATAAWCALAQNINSFITARAFCGLGAGGVLAMGPIMTNDLVPVSIRGTYQGYINIAVGVGSACGAAFGGLLCDTLGWRWAFGIQVPFILLILSLALFTTPSSLGPHLAKHSNQSFVQLLNGIDLTGSCLLAASLACLILALNLGGNVYSWSHPVIISSLMLSAITIFGLIRVEQKAERPVMPLTMLSVSPRANLVFSNFAAYMGYSTIIFNIPLFFRVVSLETASASGLRQAVPNIAVTVFGVLSGYSMTWTGRMKGLIFVGCLFMFLGSFSLTSMWYGIPTWLATLFLIPTSIGMGLNTPAVSVAVLATSKYEEQAVMTITLMIWRRLGAVMGVAISSLILQNTLSSRLDQLVTGPHKIEVITRIRKSIHAIFELSPKNQSEVVLAYYQSLKSTFGFAVIAFTIATLLVYPVKLLNLRKLRVHGRS